MFNQLVKSFVQRNHRFLRFYNTLSNPKVQQYIQEEKQHNRPGLARIIQSIREKQSELAELGRLAENPDLKEIANADRKSVQLDLKELEAQFFDSVIEPTELDSCNECVMELSAGVGGQEAMLFTQELLNMYLRYSKLQGWDVELVSLGESELGGLRYATVSVNGLLSFARLKYEAGVHRVQRVPKTEKSGRIHTSTSTIAVLPTPSKVQIQLKPEDLKIETKRASGAGGQHVNTTESAVRITHLPTGISVDSQMERSQIRNREIGLRLLSTKLYELQLNRNVEERKGLKKSQVGLGNRNEKIRTYNFPQDRITDHRIGFTTFGINSFMEDGKELCTLIQKLEQFERNDRLKKLFD